jgi:hypothetical protein
MKAAKDSEQSKDFFHFCLYVQRSFDIIWCHLLLVSCFFYIAAEASPGRITQLDFLCAFNRLNTFQ